MMFKNFEEMLADSALKLSVMIVRRQSEIGVMKNQVNPRDYLDRLHRVRLVTMDIVVQLRMEHRN